MCYKGRRNWPSRSHFPSLVSYRLDHIHWKSVGSILWTQGYCKRWTALNNLLLRASTPPPPGGRGGKVGAGWLLDRVLDLSILELCPPCLFSFTIPRFQSKKAPEGNWDLNPSACSSLTNGKNLVQNIKGACVNVKPPHRVYFFPPDAAPAQGQEFNKVENLPEYAGLPGPS